MSVLCLGQSKVSHILIPLACYPRSLAFTLFRVHAPTWVPSDVMICVGLSPLDCLYLGALWSNTLCGPLSSGLPLPFFSFLSAQAKRILLSPSMPGFHCLFFFLDVLPVSHIMFSFYFCAVRILSRIQASKRIKRQNYFRLFLLSSHLCLLLSLELESVGRYRK